MSANNQPSHSGGDAKGDYTAVKIADQNDNDIKINKPHTAIEMKALSPKRKMSRVKPEKRVIPYWLRWPMFWFPHLVDEKGARIVGVQVFTVSVLGLVFVKEQWNWILNSALFADFALRFFFGPTGSVLGAVASIFVSSVTYRELVPGAPKQFAALLGTIMTLIITVALWASDRADTQNTGSIIARVFLAFLVFASFLEGFVGFCLGCWIFRYMHSFGLISKDIYLVANSIYNETEEQASEIMRRTNPPTPKKTTLVSDEETDKVPISYKSKTDDQKREDFDVIKHMSVDNFSSPLGVVGVAYMWRTAEDVIGTPHSVSLGLIYFAVVWFGLFLLAFLARILMYPSKIVKEFNQHPTRNYYALLPLNILIFAAIAIAQEKFTLAEVLFWIAGPFQAVCTFYVVGLWIMQQMDDDYMDPSWMIPVVGNLVSALVFTSIKPEYNEPAYFFFSFGFFMWIVLSAITFHRAINGSPIPDEARITLMFYIAAPAVAALSAAALQGSWTLISIMSLYIALAMFCMMFFLLMFAYIGRIPFAISYWAYVFPLAALAIASLDYHAVRGLDGTNAIAQILLITTTAVALIILINTVNAFVKRTIFVPRPKVAPIMGLARIIHYALRFGLQSLRKEARNLDNNANAARFCTLYRDIIITHDAHATHEDEILFPAVLAYAPGHAETGISGREHEEQHKFLAEVTKVVDELEISIQVDADGQSEKRAEIIKRLKPMFEQMEKSIGEHLDAEEAHVSVLARKYFSVSLQKELVKRMWERIPLSSWRRILPFIVKYQPLHKYRLRMVKSFESALPNHLQLIGLILYENIDRITWERMVVDVPSLVPRFLPGWIRRY